MTTINTSILEVESTDFGLLVRGKPLFFRLWYGFVCSAGFLQPIILIYRIIVYRNITAFEKSNFHCSRNDGWYKPLKVGKLMTKCHIQGLEENQLYLDRGVNKKHEMDVAFGFPWGTASRAATSPWLRRSEEGAQRCSLDVLHGETFLLWLLPVTGAFPNVQYLGRTFKLGQNKMLKVGMRKGGLGTSSAVCPSFYPSAGHAEAQFWPLLISASVLLFFTLETPPPHQVDWSCKGDSLEGCKTFSSQLFFSASLRYKVTGK